MFDALSLLHEMRSVKIRKHSRTLLRAEGGLLGSSSVERWTVETLLDWVDMAQGEVCMRVE